LRFGPARAQGLRAIGAGPIACVGLRVSMGAMYRFFPALGAAALLLCAGLAVASAPWRLLSEKDGLRIEGREVAGSAMPEIRVSARSRWPAARIAAAIWAERPGTKLHRRYPRTRVVLREDASERVVYQRVSAPVVSERDYTVRMHREGDGQSGPFQVRFWLANEAGPAPVRGVVRLSTLRGAWTVTPSPGGGCDVVYTIHSEPGGSLPAFLVRRPYIDSARELVMDVLEWAEGHP
jgi:hypothetical protein